jgi:probable phosphoglycerate mutase
MRGCVALFSHGHLLRALAMRWIELPLGAGMHFGLDAASLSRLGYEHNNVREPAIELWNEASKQPPEPQPAAG